jgi:hypothetical protein
MNPRLLLTRGSSGEAGPILGGRTVMRWWKYQNKPMKTPWSLREYHAQKSAGNLTEPLSVNLSHICRLNRERLEK